MKKIRPLLLFFGIILLGACFPTAHHHKDIENLLYDAYQVQKIKVENSGKSIIGYKAGLTSKAGQAKFGVSEPVAGVLFQDGLSHSRQAYQLNDYKKLMLETEIGFVINSDLEHTLSKPQHLYKLIEAVVPVIELPNLDYPDISTVTGHELIETNVASNHVLVGAKISIGDININQIQTQLSRNGQILIKGKATDAMGDQMVALHWLVNTLIKSGYSLKEGDILITGALGKMIPAERGQYDADFGQLGKLSFSIR